MPQGASWHHDPSDGEGYYDAAVANSSNLGGNVYQQPGQLLAVNVTRLAFWDTGALAVYPGTTGQVVSPSTATYFFIDSAGLLATSTVGWPGGQHIPLAIVTTSLSEITQIEDFRPVLRMGP